MENVFGEPLQTHNAFINLVGSIESSLSDHMSESTLERLWGYSTRSCDAVSMRTLNVLAKYVGAASWNDFCRCHKENSVRESEEITGEFIDVSTLVPGTVLRLGWMPDRIIEIRYLGNYRFTVLKSVNSNIVPGDSFSCIHIKMGRELYLDKYARNSDSEVSYVVGQSNGITTAEIIA